MNLADFCIIAISLIGSIPWVSSVLQTDKSHSHLELLLELPSVSWQSSKANKFHRCSLFVHKLKYLPGFMSVFQGHIAWIYCFFQFCIYFGFVLKTLWWNKIWRQISGIPRNSFCSSTNVCRGVVRRWVSPYTSLSVYQQNRERTLRKTLKQLKSMFKM